MDGKVDEPRLIFDFTDEDANQKLYDFLEDGKSMEKFIEKTLGSKYKVKLKYSEQSSTLRVQITRSEFDSIKDRRAFNNIIDEFEQEHKEKIEKWYEEGKDIVKELNPNL